MAIGNIDSLDALEPDTVSEGDSDGPVWVPVTEYARHYSLGESTVRKAVRDNRIRAVRLLDRTIRVDITDTGVA